MPTTVCDGRTVELRPHIGRLTTATHVETVDLGQWFVLLGGIHVGYLRTAEGSSLVWLEELTEADAAAITTACETLIGWRPGSGPLKVSSVQEDEGDE